MTFYNYDEDDPQSPQLLTEYNGLRAGMRVLYHNPAYKQPDGTYRTGGMDPPLVISELCRFPIDDDENHVQAILNDGAWECNADNLVPDEDLDEAIFRAERYDEPIPGATQQGESQ